MTALDLFALFFLVFIGWLVYRIIRIFFWFLNLFSGKKRNPSDDVQIEYPDEESAGDEEAPPELPESRDSVVENAYEKQNFDRENPTGASLGSTIENVSIQNTDLDARRTRASKLAALVDDLVDGDRTHKLNRIPIKKLTLARKSMIVPDSDTVLALFDDTVMGSGETGALVSLDGFYWKNGFEDPKFLRWEKFLKMKAAGQISFLKNKIEIKGLGKVDLLWSNYNTKSLVALLQAVD